MTYVIPQKGDRIELLEMPEDPCPVEVGTTGTVINVVRDGVRSATNDPLLVGVPPVHAGQPLGGRFFPLLTPRSPRAPFDRQSRYGRVSTG